MVQPIRPVTLSLLALPPAVFARACLITLPYRLLCACWADLASTCGAAATRVTPPPQGSEGALPSQIDAWKPWPADSPWVDDVGRWWPSDEFPPPLPAAAGEGPVVVQPTTVLWRDTGGLLDMVI